MERIARRLAAAALVAAACAAAPGGAAAAPPCVASPAPAVPAGTAQIVSVSASSTRSTLGTLSLWTRSGDCWTRDAGPWTARLGFAGLSAHHVEGDGTTPLGAFPLGPVVYGVAPDPGTRLAYHRLTCGDWWDEDPGSPTYNRFRSLPCGASPSFGGASEPLWRSTRAYRHLLVVEYNVRPTIPGRGSAIFVHADLGHATNGCVSLPLPRLVKLIRLLRPDARPYIAIATAR